MTNSELRLITCVLPKGVAPPVLAALAAQFDVPTANINSARGIGKITPLKYRGLGDQSEKDILTVMVEEKQADEIFEFIYFEADINRPHGGLMYLQTLGEASHYVLPELPDEQ